MGRGKPAPAPGDAKASGRIWVLPIPLLLLLAEIGRLCFPTSPLLPIAEIMLGLYAALARAPVSCTLLDWQQRWWGFPYGAKEMEASMLVVGATGLGLLAAGAWDLLRRA